MQISEFNMYFNQFVNGMTVTHPGAYLHISCSIHYKYKWRYDKWYVFTIYVLFISAIYMSHGPVIPLAPMQNTILIKATINVNPADIYYYNDVSPWAGYAHRAPLPRNWYIFVY